MYVQTAFFHAVYVSTNGKQQISVAHIAGMEAELKLNVENRYSVALLVFFIPYFMFEVSSLDAPHWNYIV